MKVKLILPAPPALATLAGHLPADWDVDLADDQREHLSLDDSPDLVVIEVDVTNACRAYAIADRHRAKGRYVVLGGRHVTSFPEQAAVHADTILVGPDEQVFPCFLRDWRAGHASARYIAGGGHTIEGIPPEVAPTSSGCGHHDTALVRDASAAGERCRT